jgi:large subunit ribosomal protein L30
MSKLKITLRHSPIGNTEKHRATVRSLGLRKMQQSVVREDSPIVQGMIAKVRHLLEVEAVTEE